MADLNLKVEYVPIESITPYKNNAKRHPKRQIEQIVKSIQQFGMDDPIGVWKNTIVEGHGRLEACKQLGYKTIPIIRLDHLTDEQRKAYTLVHNQLAISTTFDLELVKLELEDVTSINMADFGFDFSSPTDGLVELDEDDITPDAIDPEAYEVRMGDVFKLGTHFLMCGDATNIDHVKRLIGNSHIHLAFTDPPYGVSVVSSEGFVGSDNDVVMSAKRFKCIAYGAPQSAKYQSIKGDDSTETAQANYNIISQISDNQIIWGGNYFTDFLPVSKCWLSWNKEVPDGLKFANAEFAWTSFSTYTRCYPWMWTGFRREGDTKEEGKNRIHPTQKPVGLTGEILQDFSNEGDNILDCFGGSGTTLIACEMLKRNCFMMEYSEHYVNAIIQRWEKYTGLKAERLPVVDSYTGE